MYTCIYRAVAICYRAKVCLHEKVPQVYHISALGNTCMYMHIRIYIYKIYAFVYVCIYRAAAICYGAKACLHEKVTKMYHVSALKYMYILKYTYIYIYIHISICMYI